MNPATETPLAAARGHNAGAPPDQLDGIEVPAALQASLARHRDNLARLVRGLQAAGVAASQIEASLTVLVDSYKAELLAAIRTLMEQRFD